MKKILYVLPVIALLAAACGSTQQTNNQTPTTENTNPAPQIQTEQDKFNQAIAKRKAEEQANPPAGYLLPNNVPPEFKLTSSRFTNHSTNYYYQKLISFKIGQNTATSTVFLGFSEDGAKQTYDDFVKTNTEATFPIMKVEKTFVYNGINGSVIQEYVNQKAPLGEYWLAYNHNGRLLIIHTDDAKSFEPDNLISLLETMTVSK